MIFKTFPINVAKSRNLGEKLKFWRKIKILVKNGNL